ncbi:putative non-canonical poly(A) RNA polymerase PAPD5/7 [Blattamonas nauphoetae]|uniref:Non-canonical poly(A) RNA polymerase PAPD5/7 n=1 Tax=Blattamonas nauphoetae TaxID=2049346 RepID=A0ABQ9WXV8_9EUKA|nr:putative non-canonical poly(A) RNA polymerase PAPD5/7 [Blattamonas nauphoetae]
MIHTPSFFNLGQASKGICLPGTPLHSFSQVIHIQRANAQIRTSSEFFSNQDEVAHRFALVFRENDDEMFSRHSHSTDGISIHLEPAQYKTILNRYTWALEHVNEYVLCEDPLDALSAEILDFTQFMSPTLAEYLFRRQIVDRISGIVHSISKKGEVHVYGSCSTGLFLPQADIDLTILGLPNGLPSFFVRQPISLDVPSLSFSSTLSMKQPSQILNPGGLTLSGVNLFHLTASNLPYASLHPQFQMICGQNATMTLHQLHGKILSEASTSETLFLPNAKVPVLKHIDKSSRWNIDISLNGMNGIINSFIVRDFLYADHKPHPAAQIPLNIPEISTDADGSIIFVPQAKHISSDISDSPTMVSDVLLGTNSHIQEERNMKRRKTKGYSTKELYKHIRPLIIVLKSYLMKERLSETYHGGMGSYLLSLLVISHLQMFKRNYQSAQNSPQDPFPSSEAPSLGRLLITFFHLYGLQFDYLRNGISIRNNGFYFNKEEWREGIFNPALPSPANSARPTTDFFPERTTSRTGTPISRNGAETPTSIVTLGSYLGNEKENRLCVEDPQRPDFDVGRGCFQFVEVRAAFERAYLALSTGFVLHRRVWECIGEERKKRKERGIGRKDDSREEEKTEKNTKEQEEEGMRESQDNSVIDMVTTPPPTKSFTTHSFNIASKSPSLTDWQVSGSERVSLDVQLRPTLLGRILQVDVKFRDWRDKLNTTLMKKMKAEWLQNEDSLEERMEDVHANPIPKSTSSLSISTVPVSPSPTHLSSPPPAPSPIPSSFTSYLDSLIVSIQNSQFEWELQNADVLFADFFVSCTAAPSVLPQCFISNSIGVSEARPVLTPQEAFDELRGVRDEMIEMEAREDEEEERKREKRKKGRVLDDEESDPISDQTANHFTSYVPRFSTSPNPYSLLNSSPHPLPPSFAASHSPNSFTTGLAPSAPLPAHSFSSLLLVKHPVLSPLLSTLITNSANVVQQAPSTSHTPTLPRSRTPTTEPPISTTPTFSYPLHFMSQFSPSMERKQPPVKSVLNPATQPFRPRMSVKKEEGKKVVKEEKSPEKEKKQKEDELKSKEAEQKLDETRSALQPLEPEQTSHFTPLKPKAQPSISPTLQPQPYRPGDAHVPTSPSEPTPKQHMTPIAKPSPQMIPFDSSQPFFTDQDSILATALSHHSPTLFAPPSDRPELPLFSLEERNQTSPVPGTSPTPSPTPGFPLTSLAPQLYSQDDTPKAERMSGKEKMEQVVTIQKNAKLTQTEQASKEHASTVSEDGLAQSVTPDRTSTPEQDSNQQETSPLEFDRQISMRLSRTAEGSSEVKVRIEIEETSAFSSLEEMQAAILREMEGTGFEGDFEIEFAEEEEEESEDAAGDGRDGEEGEERQEGTEGQEDVDSTKKSDMP